MAGVPGSQPADLLVPTANGQQQSVNVGQLTQFKAPPMPQAAPQTGGGGQDLDSLLDQHLGAPSAPSQGDSLDSILDQHLNTTEPAPFMQRVKAGFAGNEGEKEGYLKQEYGKENVRKNKTGDYEVKEQGKWHPFNADYHMPDIMGGMQQQGPSIGDPANLGRQAMVELGAAPAEIAGGIAAAGEGASGVGAPGMAPTMAAARIAGGATGEALARHTAYNIIGIPKSGDYATDAAAMAEQGGMRGIFGKVADKVSAYLAGHLGEDATGAVAKNIADETKDAVEGLGKGAHQQAIQGSLSSDKVASEAVLKEQAAKTQLEIAKGLNDDAVKANLPPLKASELFPHNKKVQDLTDVAAASPIFHNASLVRGKQLSGAIESLGDTFQPGNATAKSAYQYLSSADRMMEPGGEIGAYRKALNDSTSRVPTPILKQAASDMQKEMGFTQLPSGEFIPPTDLDKAELATGITNRGQLKAFINRVTEISDDVANNVSGMEPKKLDSLYNEFKGIIANNPAHENFPVFKRAVQLKNAARDDFANGIGSVLRPEDQLGYEAAMKRYHDVVTASDTLGSILDHKDIAAHDLVNFLKQGGPGNVDRVNAVKTIVMQESPQSWEAIGKAYFDQLVNKHSMLGPKGDKLGNINWTGMQKELIEGGKGYEQLKAIVGDKKADTLVALANYGAAAQGGMREMATRPGLITGFVRLIAKQDPTYMKQIFFSDRAARTAMSSEYTEKIMKNLQPEVQSRLRGAYNEAMDALAKQGPNMATGLPAQQATQAIQNQQQQPQQ